MTVIVKTHQPPSLATACVQWSGLCAQVQSVMHSRSTHPARTVVLLPFYQLHSVARQASQAQWPTGFTPRWETTTSWSQRLDCFVPSALDLRFDAAHDSLQAMAMLAKAGLADKQALLVPSLLEAAQQLGGVVAALPPGQRGDWALNARSVVAQGMGQGYPLAYEAAIARIALEWALASRYATDVLFDEATAAQLDCLIVVQGLQANALATALATHWSTLACTLAFDALPESGHVQLHRASDAHDEADRASACVLAHLNAGRTPVALAAVDRVLTRRISATLALHGVAVLDETGWKLSTTRCAAALMALLRAARWDAGEDAFLDWLKHTGVQTGLLNALEQAFRGQNMPSSHVEHARAAIEFIADNGQAMSADALLQALRQPRTISQWLVSLGDTLRSCGMWEALVHNEAGAACVAALQLQTPGNMAHFGAVMRLGELSTWVQATLEAASFKARRDDQTSAPVTVLPLAQVLARPFAALVLPGADEAHLPRSPDPVGVWSATQRLALGLPGRDALAAEQARVWQCAMTLAQVDVLWRSAQGDQAVLPCVWVQAMLAARTSLPLAPDPRRPVAVQPVAIARPLPSLPGVSPLRPSRLSASAYEDLRTCPYRYFALRVLGLQEASELDTEVAKRDFGSWLHAVLAQFHKRRKAAEDTVDRELLDSCAAEQRSPGSGFIPFAASWPQVRESYLAWLAQHEAAGWQFDVGEKSGERAHAGITLVGRIDRIDRLSRGPTAGTAFVLDYKTEAAQTSKARVRDPLEDTQLAFYAALLGEDDIEAAYVNIAERLTVSTPQSEVMAARDALLGGIADDVQRIHAGAPMPALGEGKACDYCAARGLCRKDFWTP